MYRATRFLSLFALSLFTLTPRAFGFGFPGANDNIFPPAAAAKPFIDFDGRGFLIRGKRTFIVAGDMHYSRVPRALWRDRLLRVKRAGYNTIQTYTFWNYHETRAGQFDFSGDKDLNAYLKLIQSLGMYAIVRVGPYVNAEWDSGGWPVWLRFVPGLIVRENNRPYLYYLDRWLTHLMPIVAQNQINRGGPIIMVQLENEDTRGAGTDIPNPYFKHLKDKCVALGLQVPFFFSGINHSDNPAGDAPFDITQRTSPWYSSEFWTGWIQFYGADAGRTRDRIRATWNILANGGAGYTHYTIAGGTDFETWGCDAQAASYDFGAPIGQAGDLRPMYFGFKRAALFATSFPEILANAADSTAQLQGAATGANIAVLARSGPAGTVIFLKNDTDTPSKTQIKDSSGTLLPVSGPFTVDAHEMMPIVENTEIAPGVTLQIAAARILGVSRQGNTTTIVIYGAVGDPAELHFTTPHGQPAVYKGTFTAQPHLTFFPFGNQIVRVLAVSSDMADRTWFVSDPHGKRDIILGPDYVGEVGLRNGKLILETEQLASDTAKPGLMFLISPDGKVKSLVQTSESQAAPATLDIPALANWRVASGVAPAQPTTDMSAWKASAVPLAMGADGDPSAYAWYRATVHANAAGQYHLHFADAGDWLAAFVNGVPAGHTDVRQRFETAVPRAMDITLPAGDSGLAILAAHGGREKLHAYIGPLDQIDAKGINGAVTLSQSAGVKTALNVPPQSNVPITHWLMHGGITLPWPRDAVWKTLPPGNIPDQPTFFQATFTDTPTAFGPHPVLRVSPMGLSRGFMWLNGHSLGRYPERSPVDGLYLPECWIARGRNTVEIFDEEGHTPVGVKIIAETIAGRTQAELSTR